MREPITYVVSFPRVLKTVIFLVPGCPEVAHSADQMRENFIYRNFFAQTVVVQEGRDPLPHCDR